MIDSAVMKAGGDGVKLWVVDLDDVSDNEVEVIAQCIDDSQSGFEKNIIAKIPTVHGYHFITHPFDTRKLGAIHPSVEVKKEGLTLLYAHVPQ